MRDFERSERGFTLIEIVVVLAVVAVLAAVMTPAVIKHLTDSRTARAQNDVKVVAAALSDFFKDTGRWPTDRDADHSVSDQELRLLTSAGGELPGEVSGGAGWLSLRPADVFDNHLIDNQPNGASANAYPSSGELKWAGPYLNELKPDPWGRKFLCNVGSFHPGQTGPVWVLSAGPDGIIQTNATSRTLAGDDIGFLLRR